MTGLGVVGEGGLQLLFDEKPIRLAYWRDFTIRNRTGSTLRDLNLIVTYDPPTNDEQVDPHFQFQTYKSNDIVVSASRHIEERMFSYEIERFDRGGKWSGRVMATYRADIRLVTNNDVEVFQSDRMSVFHPKQLMWQAGPLILFLIAINLNKIFD